MSNSTRDVGQRIARCVSRIGVLLEIGDGDAITAHLQGGRFCHARLCPFCEWRRSLAWKARLGRGLEAFTAEHPTHRALFLTLTVRNCPVDHVRTTIRDMHRGWERLTKLKEFPAAHWLRRTEITVPSPEISIGQRQGSPPIHCPAADVSSLMDDPTDTPRARLADRPQGPAMVHPHMHALLLVPASYFSRGYIRQTRWQELWQMSARLDYAPVVDVRTAYSSEHKSSDRAPIGAVVNEAAKYISKAADVVKLGPYVAELHHQIRGLRMIQASAKFSRYVKNEDPTDAEMLDALDGIDPHATFMPVVAEWSDQQEAYLFAGQPDAHDLAIGQ